MIKTFELFGQEIKSIPIGLGYLRENMKEACNQCMGRYVSSPLCKLLPNCESEKSKTLANSVIFKAVDAKAFKLAALLHGVEV